MDRKQSFWLLSAVALGTTVYNILKPIRSDVSVVDNFDKKKYLGTWHEIARLDFFWEKDLKNVNATYSLRDDGKIKVVNRGFHVTKNKQKESTGKAVFVRSEKEGALKVSFFGPLYAEYNVVHIDEDYQHALVFGRNTDYLWILSREKTLAPEIVDKYIQYAKESGYDTSRLVWTIQD